MLAADYGRAYAESFANGHYVDNVVKPDED